MPSSPQSVVVCECDRNKFVNKSLTIANEGKIKTHEIESIEARSLCGSLNERRHGPTHKSLHKLVSWLMKELIDHKVPSEVKWRARRPLRTAHSAPKYSWHAFIVGNGAPSFKPPCSVRYRPPVLKMALHVSLSEQPPTGHACLNVPVVFDSGMPEEHNACCGHDGARSGWRVLTLRVHHSAPTVPTFAHFRRT